MRILMYLSIICLGAWFGYRDKLSVKILDKLSKIQYFCLLLLLFIMGINIGINDQVIKTFYTLGYQALVLSLCSILFSILGVKMVSKFIFKEAKEVSKDVH